MNCLQCNAPLDKEARFCRNCGYPVATASPAIRPLNDAPTVATRQEMPFPQPQYAQQPQWQTPLNRQDSAPRRRRRKWPWPLRVLITLVVLAGLLVGGWFLAARPILHSMAVNQFNQVIASKLDLIVPLPLINTVPITENLLNNLIALDPPPAPLQGAVVHIAPPVLASDGSYTGGVQFDFRVYGFACSMTMIPIASNGRIVTTHMQVNGIVSWILSADDMTSLLNAQLQNAVTRLHRQVVGVTLKVQEVDIQLGSVAV